MSPDFKGIKSLRLEDSITHLPILFYNRKLKTMFDLSCNTHTVNEGFMSFLTTRKSIYLEPNMSLMLPKTKKNEFNK